MSEVRVYGTDWCEDTQHTRESLDGMGVGYDYIDIEKDAEAAQYVRDMNGGQQVTPTVNIMGEILVEPNDAELGAALRSTGLMA